MSWIGTSVPVGDEMYLYYAGYKWCRKYHHSIERQIGLVKTIRDRYLARQVYDKTGHLTTPVVTLGGNQLALNVDTTKGEVREQVCDANGEPLAGFTFADCQPLPTDSLSAPVAWKVRKLGELQGKSVRLQFALLDAKLYPMEVKVRR